MTVHNAEVADIFEEVADLLDIEGANPFRIRAYRNAARLLRNLRTGVTALLDRGKNLAELPGIGDDLAGKITEIVQTGSLAMLERMRREMPPIALELLHIPGMGPKRVHTLYGELDIHTQEQLHRALLDGRIRALPGFGPKIETALRQAIETTMEAPKRFSVADVAPIARSIVAYLETMPESERVIVAGSYRRARETVGDLDILVTATDGKRVIEHFTSYEDVKEIVAAGTTRATVVLRTGLQVDLRVVPAESYGAALHYFTGSKSHNIALRTMAKGRGLKINEYGVFRGKRRIAGETEASVYRTLQLPYIEPELRENRGEIEAARKKQLPDLIELGDLRGDLHAHTKATDGHNSIREMAEAAQQRGLQYIAITEHSRRLTVAHGLTPKRLTEQIKSIDRINAEKRGITILKGIEVDILEDGSLDLPDSVLGKLDIVVGAIHSKFNLSRARQTERVLRAMAHPYFTMLAHPTGRLIPRREPYDIDMARVIRAAKDHGCFLELNAHPERLDLYETHCQMAKSAGVLVSINSDAHRTGDFDNLALGIGQARRGWLEKADVLNTRSLKQLQTLLRKRATGRA